jgi:hypothetical protein
MCHKIYSDFTGPNLYGVTDRRPKKWLYDFTRHAGEMIHESAASIYTKTGDGFLADSSYSRDPYAICLFNKYGSLMTSFPFLSDWELDKIYSYIKSESDKHPPTDSSASKSCCDSCEAYHIRMHELLKTKGQLIDSNERYFNIERDIPIPPNIGSASIPNNNTSLPLSDNVSRVSTRIAKAVYYTINIQAVGWYNLDILMKDYSECQPSELFVRIQGSYKIELNIVLVIPSVKAFVEGGKLSNANEYGFDEANGKIPLPKAAKAYIMAFGEYENKIIFGQTGFTTQLKQTIDVTLLETTKQKMTEAIRSLKLDDVNVDIHKSKNADKIAEADMGIKEAKKLLPKNCNCGQPTAAPLSLNKP